MLAADRVYMTVPEFIQRAFPGVEPDKKKLWLAKEQKRRAETIIDHSLGLRMRYWGSDSRTAWLLEEIGKESLIGIGVVVEDNQIVDLQILVYRESRGGEVRYRFFTGQFMGVALQSDSALDTSIDGISGATLSVRAVTRAARLALYLHRISPYQGAVELPAVSVPSTPDYAEAN